MTERARPSLWLVVPALLVALCSGFCCTGWLWDGVTARRIVSRQVGCPVDELTVVSHEGSLFEDRYFVEGCGRRFLLYCGAQDSEGCVAWPCEERCEWPE